MQSLRQGNPMLKRIAVKEVELGMFIHKLDGSWFDHPFWKSRFLLEDPENLRDLRASGIAAVLIDTSKGKDVAAPAPVQKKNAPPPVRAKRSHSAPPHPGFASCSGQIAGVDRPDINPAHHHGPRNRRGADRRQSRAEGPFEGFCGRAPRQIDQDAHN